VARTNSGKPPKKNRRSHGSPTPTARTDKQQEARLSNLRRTYDLAASYVNGYAVKEVRQPHGLTGPRWQPNTIELAKAYLATLFGLEPAKGHAGAKEADFEPSVLKVIREKFVLACAERNLRGVPGQDTAWYAALRAELDSRLLSLLQKDRRKGTATS
jgi:hypothetical protein